MFVVFNCHLYNAFIHSALPNFEVACFHWLLQIGLANLHLLRFENIFVEILEQRVILDQFLQLHIQQSRRKQPHIKFFNDAESRKVHFTWVVWEYLLLNAHLLIKYHQAIRGNILWNFIFWFILIGNGKSLIHCCLLCRLVARMKFQTSQRVNPFERSLVIFERRDFWIVH